VSSRDSIWIEPGSLTRDEAIDLHERNARAIDVEIRRVAASRAGRSPRHQEQCDVALRNLRTEAHDERELAELARVFDYPYPLREDPAPQRTRRSR